jgi:hypothetical protein
MGEPTGALPGMSEHVAPSLQLRAHISRLRTLRVSTGTVAKK